MQLTIYFKNCNPLKPTNSNPPKYVVIAGGKDNEKPYVFALNYSNFQRLEGKITDEELKTEGTYYIPYKEAIKRFNFIEIKN